MNAVVIGAFVLLQAVISIKPGFVHFTDGKVNVRKFEQLEAGKKIETGPNGRVEIGLGTDALLRLDENSVAVIESIDKSDVAVHIDSGTAVVEVEKLEKTDRIRISDGDLKTTIDFKGGAFRYSDNSVSVLDGKLMVTGAPNPLQKGFQASMVNGDYRQTKLTLNTPQVFTSYLNSQKAGFVNAIHGDNVNVRLLDTVHTDQPVQTGESSYVELLLRPGAFMRVNENSSVVIESAGANDVVVKVVSGDALIENIVGEDRLPIRVEVGGIKTLIASHGLYKFTSDTGSVIDGVLRIGKNGEAAFNGMQVRIVDKMYDTTELKPDAEPSGLDLWSTERSQLLSKANFIADYADSQPNFFLFVSDRSFSAAWIYSPLINGITFITQMRRESYYGTSFVPSYPLMPSPAIVPAGMRVPPQQPNLPVVTPAPTSQPAPSTPPTTPAPSTPAPATPKPPGK
jgi:hypothetical protein